MKQDTTYKNILVDNAGLVIFKSYFNILFERLLLLEGDHFKTKEDQKKAIRCLQYLATGDTDTEGNKLVLNKILCGLAPEESVHEKLELKENEQQLIESLISSVIAFWKEIERMSVENFRNSFLKRKGFLEEEQDQLFLRVEKAPYDVLMRNLPFSISPIQNPWMKKRLIVEWYD